MFTVVISESRVTAPVLVVPARFKAIVVAVAVVSAPDVPALTVEPVPSIVNEVRAPELIVAPPPNSLTLTVVIVPAAVSEVEFASVMVIAPSVIPTLPVTLVVTATPSTLTKVAVVMLVPASATSAEPALLYHATGCVESRLLTGL